MRKFTIGTRGSMLARAQAQFIKSKLESTTPHKFELKIIKTQGDQIQDKPLWQLEGKDFFTKELDQELVNGSIDLVVHSFKDLGGERPPGITLAAVTKRTNPADVLITKKETVRKLLKKEFERNDFIIGTSSPRRIFQSKEIKNYLPNFQNLQVKIKNLRGNVDSRIKKLLSGDFDAIILAAAGLERITYLTEGMEAISNFAKEITYMILPVQTFTPAPAQGALAIDCRSDDYELQKILKTLEDPKSKNEVLKEKEIFQRYGGGCHLPLGIYCKSDGKSFFITETGKDNNEKQVSKSSLFSPEPPLQNLGIETNFFIGIMKKPHWENVIFDELIDKIPVESKAPHPNHFISTKHAVLNLKKNVDSLTLPPIFAAGPHSMKKIAEGGFWCHGSVNSQGDEKMLEHISSKTFNLFHSLQEKWNVYTHKESNSSVGETTPSYERKLVKDLPEQWIEKLKDCNVFYWSSYAQYKVYAEQFPTLKDPIKNKLTFFTGLGKTKRLFEQNGIEAFSLSSVKLLAPYIKGYRDE